MSLLGKIFKKEKSDERASGEQESFVAKVSKNDDVELKPIPFNLNDTLRDVANILAMEAQDKRISIIYRLKNNVPSKLIGDRYKFARILTDLIGNAIDFTDKVQDVVVNLSRNEENNEYIELHGEIIDYGIGVDEATVKDVLVPMLRSNKPASHFGIDGEGLERSRDIIHAMQGSITINCTKSKGCKVSFHVRLEAPNMREKRHYRLPTRDGVGLYTLVIDDDVGSGQAVVSMLEYFRHRVTLAEIGALEDAASFDLLLISEKFWNDNVRATLKAMGIKRPKIVLIDNMMEQKHIDEAHLDTVEWLIYKPFTQQAVFEMLAALYTNALAHSPEVEEAAQSLKSAPKEDGKSMLSPTVDAFLKGRTFEVENDDEDGCHPCRHFHQFFIAADGLKHTDNDYTQFVETLRDTIWKYGKTDRLLASMIERGVQDEAIAHCAQMRERLKQVGIYRLACIADLLESAMRDERLLDRDALMKSLPFALTQTLASVDGFIEQAKYKLK